MTIVKQVEVPTRREKAFRQIRPNDDSGVGMTTSSFSAIPNHANKQSSVRFTLKVICLRRLLQLKFNITFLRDQEKLEMSFDVLLLLPRCLDQNSQQNHEQALRTT